MPTVGQRTLLAFDYGEKRLGVAVGQELTGGVRPLTILPCRDGQPDWQAVTKLLATWQPDALVLGIPLHLDGTPQPLTEQARRFGRQLAGRYNLPVFEADERLSSDEAERRRSTSGSRQPHIDDLAAQVILEGWLAQQREKTQTP